MPTYESLRWGGERPHAAYAAMQTQSVSHPGRLNAPLFEHREPTGSQRFDECRFAASLRGNG